VLVTVGDAASTLRNLQIVPSSAFHTQIVKASPQVVQVWFEPDSPPTAPAPALTSHLVVQGSAKFAPDQITWAAAAPSNLPQGLAAGGRIQIRIHCDHLIDVNLRVFSGAADAATTFDSGVRPSGGIFESWFFVRAG
jgi:hypothetical protein